MGIASAHSVRVLNAEGDSIGELPTMRSLTDVETAASAGTRLEVVIEPTGPAWLPTAVFIVRGHLVYRVSSMESAHLRRFLSRHAKTDGIDADTLARLPLFHPAGCASARA